MHKAKLIVPIYLFFNDTKFKLGTKIYSGLFAKWQYYIALSEL